MSISEQMNTPIDLRVEEEGDPDTKNLKQSSLEELSMFGTLDDLEPSRLQDFDIALPPLEDDNYHQHPLIHKSISPITCSPLKSCTRPSITIPTSDGISGVWSDSLHQYGTGLDAPLSPLSPISTFSVFGDPTNSGSFSPFLG